MRKTIALIVAVILLAAAALLLLRPEQSSQREPEKLADSHSGMPDDWNRVIAYVPLDDRTDNIDNVIYTAEASGYRVVMPGSELIHTCLDGQETNPDGTQYGSREALLEWVREMDERGCDLFLLSLDQLMSGGLVNSRAVGGSLPLEFADGTVMSEDEAFDSFILALGEDENNRVYLFDSVMRLASTVGYQGLDYDEYTALRAYGKVARPELTGAELTLGNIFAAYPLSADGATPAKELAGDAAMQSVLSDEVIESYLAARERKLELLDHVLKALENKAQFKLLVGIDDSSNTPSIQTNELAYISGSMGENAALIGGPDCLARLLVGCIAQDEYGCGVRIYVEYIGGSEDLPSSDYNSCTLKETVDSHMKLYKAVYADENEAELQVIVMTKPDDESRCDEYCAALVEKLSYNAENHIPTVLIEASNNAYGKTLEEALLEKADLAGLLGFSGKYYQANVVGAGFSMGYSRYLYLRCCDEKSSACHEAQLRQLTLSLEMSYAYAIDSRDRLNAFADSLGLDGNNLVCGEDDREKITAKLEELMGIYGEPILDNLKNGAVLCGLEPWEARQVEDVSVSDFYMPWSRTFEISFSIAAALK